MTWIKICGITNLEDANAAVQAGADALGFVFYEKSPRYVEPATARNLIRSLPDRIEKVGVFFGDNLFENIESMISKTGVTAMQMHPGSNASGCCAVAPERTRLLLTISARELPNIQDHKQLFIEALESLCGSRPGTAVLIDSISQQQPGGTGKAFDWEQNRKTVHAMNSRFPVIVAGGLTPMNVADAIRTLHPWGVDVSSGVEASPGKKDPDKIRAFIDAVRRVDREPTSAAKRQ